MKTATNVTSGGLANNARCTNESQRTKGYLNKKEASQYTGLSVRTLENYLHQIPHYRIGRRVLFKPSDLDSWMEQFRREPGNNVNEIVGDILQKLKEGGD